MQSDTNQRALQVLREALHLLETKGWTQEVEARDAAGEAVMHFSEAATCFCTVGALLRAAGPGTSPTDYAAYGVARKHLVLAAAEATGGDPGYISITGFNDGAESFEPVRRMFQDAIKNLEARCAE